MRLRVFQAASTPAALALMRKALGPDAVIVATQELADGARVTAAVDTEDEDLASLLAPAPDAGLLADLARVLAYHGAGTGLLDRLKTGTGPAAAGDPTAALAAAIERACRFEPLTAGWTGTLVLVGPAGAGKTAAAAKLAAMALVAGRTPLVATADVKRAGGAAQLEALLRPVELPLVRAASADELARAVRAAPEAAPVIVDTTGVNPFRGDELAGLADLLHAARGEAVLVMPAGLCPQDSAELAANFAAMGARRMIAGRLDAARRFGGLLAAAEAGLAFAAASIGPLIGKPLAPLTATGLARLLMRGRDRTGGRSA